MAKNTNQKPQANAQRMFKKILWGLPATTKKDIMQQFLALLKQVEKAQKLHHAQDYLQDFTDDVLLAEIQRRKETQTTENKADANKTKPKGKKK